jgi:hypothetical protein
VDPNPKKMSSAPQHRVPELLTGKNECRNQLIAEIASTFGGPQF